MLVNHYCAWVYQYKIENPNNTLVTEYDQCDSEGGNNGDQQDTEIHLFCGDLDLTECEISVPVSAVNDMTGTGNDNEVQQQDQEDFKILLLLDNTANPVAYEEARVREQEILKDIKAKIDLDRQGNGDPGSAGYLDSYKKMTSKVTKDTHHISTEQCASARKRKRKSKSVMTVFTSAKRRSKKTSDDIAAYLTEGKRFVCEMLHKIKQDERSGICKKWQDKYKKLSKATKQDKDKANDEEDASEDQFEVDADALYAEV
jgi:hypothetical protein